MALLPGNAQGRSVRGRIGGSGFTTFIWDNGGVSANGTRSAPTPIAFARQISHQSPTPVGPGTVPIHPMDTPYPTELITPVATTMGSITLELYELFGEPVWYRLTGLGPESQGSKVSAPVDLANIFSIVANTPNPIRVMKFISPPANAKTPKAGTQVTTRQGYTEEYNNCVISSLTDGETIEIGTMEILKQITVNYTHITRGGKNRLISDPTSVTGGGTESLNSYNGTTYTFA